MGLLGHDFDPVAIVGDVQSSFADAVADLEVIFPGGIRDTKSVAGYRLRAAGKWGRDHWSMVAGRSWLGRGGTSESTSWTWLNAPRGLRGLRIALSLTDG